SGNIYEKDLSIIAMPQIRVNRALIVLFFLRVAIFAQAHDYVISTFAGGGPPPTPVLGVDMPIGALQSVATDATGNTYFVASYCVFKLDPSGVVTRIAGDGRPGYLGDGGPATSAQLQLQNTKFPTVEVFVGGDALPPGIAVDYAGNL